MTVTSASSSRDLRFDSLRGLMLIAMTVNHLPSMLRFLTDRSLGIFSAAEGFVFISGIVAGWVYTRRRQRVGSAGLWEATRHRATMIYRWQMVSFVGALAAVRLTDQLFGFCSQNSPLLFYQHPFEAILLGAGLLYQPGMLDILPLYCAVVVALPWVIDQMENGRRWLVLSLSFLLWFTVQWAPPSDGGQFFPIVVGGFNIFAWQFLFFIGAAVGNLRVAPAGTRPAPRFRPAVFAAALALSVYGWGVAHLRWRAPGSDALFGIMLNKPSIGLIRLTDFLAFAYLVGLFGHRWPRLLTWRPVAFLGQHSIVVFSVQSVTAIVLCQFDGLFAKPAGNLTTTAVAVGLLWVSAAVHQTFQARASQGGSGAGRPAPLGARQQPGAQVGPQHDLRAT